MSDLIEVGVHCYMEDRMLWAFNEITVDLYSWDEHTDVLCINTICPAALSTKETLGIRSVHVDSMHWEYWMTRIGDMHNHRAVVYVKANTNVVKVMSTLIEAYATTSLTVDMLQDKDQLEHIPRTTLVEPEVLPEVLDDVDYKNFVVPVKFPTVFVNALVLRDLNV